MWLLWRNASCQSYKTGRSTTRIIEPTFAFNKRHKHSMWNRAYYIRKFARMRNFSFAGNKFRCIQSENVTSSQSLALAPEGTLKSKSYARCHEIISNLPSHVLVPSGCRLRRPDRAESDVLCPGHQPKFRLGAGQSSLPLLQAKCQQAGGKRAGHENSLCL